MYDAGEGLSENNKEAVKWYRSAADQGYASAQYSLGRMYDDGQGVETDDVEAVKWYRLAADQEYAAAQNMLGLHYDTGDGVELDDAEAVKFYQLAADQNYPSAQYNLGLMYEYGEGVESDEKEACRWTRSAADLGHAEATWKVSGMYAEGRCGLGRDAKLAGETLLKALSLQSSEARGELIDQRGRSLAPEVRREIQRALTAEGAYSGAIDGVFGAGTLSALERYAGGG